MKLLLSLILLPILIASCHQSVEVIDNKKEDSLNSTLVDESKLYLYYINAIGGEKFVSTHENSGTNDSVLLTSCDLDLQWIDTLENKEIQLSFMWNKDGEMVHLITGANYFHSTLFYRGKLSGMVYGDGAIVDVTEESLFDEMKKNELKNFLSKNKDKINVWFIKEIEDTGILNK